MARRLAVSCVAANRFGWTAVVAAMDQGAVETGRPVARPDQVSLGFLVAAVPRFKVDEAAAVCGVGEQRRGGSFLHIRRPYLRTFNIQLKVGSDPLTGPNWLFGRREPWPSGAPGALRVRRPPRWGPGRPSEAGPVPGREGIPLCDRPRCAPLRAERRTFLRRLSALKPECRPASEL